MELRQVDNLLHKPVMLKEALDYLKVSPGKVIVDATVGTAGHALHIIRDIQPQGALIGIDQDEDSLSIARQRLSDFRDSVTLVHANFKDLDTVLKGLNIKKVDGILFDLGISSFQLENPERGFSFQQEGPLDMRLDRSTYISAYDLLNNLNEDEISAILFRFGEERWHNRIAHRLIEERQRHPISTTSELAGIVMKSMPARYRYHRIHPATRTFQAVRIAVNRELESLELAIGKTFDLLNKNGRLCVISFHSLEDRIVKLSFKKAAAEGKINIITPKPLASSQEEQKTNPSCRSAKLRVAERI